MLETAVFTVTTIRDHAYFREWQRQKRQEPIYSQESVDRLCASVLEATEQVNNKFLIMRYQGIEQWLTVQIHIYTKCMSEKTSDWDVGANSAFRMVIRDLQFKLREVQEEVKRLSTQAR
jgi:hypothetical protein